MADRAFDRTIINPLEKPLSSDINQLQSQQDSTLRRMFERLFSSAIPGTNDRPYGSRSGFLGDSFKVRPTSPTGMNVLVTRGVGFIYNPSDVPVAIGGVLGLDDRSGYKPLLLDADQTIAVPANTSGATRYDIIEVCYSRRAENNSSRQILDPIAEQFSAAGVNKTLGIANDGRIGSVASPAASTADISYKTGGSSSAARPDVTSGYVKIADVVVINGATHITPNCIGQERSILTPDNHMHIRGVLTINVADGTATALTYDAPPGVEVYGLQAELAQLLIIAGPADWSVVPLISANTNDGAGHAGWLDTDVVIARAGDGSGITTGYCADPATVPAPRDTTNGLAKGQSVCGINFTPLKDAGYGARSTWVVNFDIILTPKSGSLPAYT